MFFLPSIFGRWPPKTVTLSKEDFALKLTILSSPSRHCLSYNLPALDNLPALEGISVKRTNRSDDRYSSSLDSNVSRFRHWNVRTMNGSEEELVDKMKRYGLEVLGVSEDEREWYEEDWHPHP